MKTVFYRAEHLTALERKIRIWKAVLALVWALTLGLCLFFALRRNTLNADRMELCATAALILGGWIAITVNDCAIRYSRVLRAHEERILAAAEAEREVRGAVTLEKKRVRIPRSIDVRGVRVQTAGGPVRLLINDAHAAALAREAARGELIVRAREGYVTEVER